MSKWNAIVASLWCGKYDNDFNDEIIAYRTFGNHDTITISPVDGETATCVLNGMWDRTRAFSNNIKHGESIHNLFGVAKSEKCDDFWGKSTPYLFLSEIQMNYKDGTEFETQLEEFEKEINTFLSELGLRENEDFVFYYSLDCGDILLFIKTYKYTVGADIINKITIKSNFKHYSYSVCGIDVNMVMSNEGCAEIIPKVVISSVFSDATNYKDWLAKFKVVYPCELDFEKSELIQDNELAKIICTKEEFVHLARLGNEDVCINIYNCDLQQFVKMLTDTNGVFSHKNEIVTSTFSRLKIQFDIKFKDIEPSKTRKLTAGASLVNQLSGVWKTKLNQEVNPFVFKALIEVLNAVENLEAKEFAIDIQDCVRNVFALFVRKIADFDCVNFEDGYSNEDFNKDLILFTTGLMSIANGALHADKLFINAPGFNAVLCDIPAKLLVYYTAFIQKLVETLNDSQNFDYRFILCPDLYLNIEVEGLFDYKKSDSQLLKARIPVKKLFDPQILLMELSHEAAHFVDTEIRSRKERVAFLSDIVSIVLADKLLRPLEFEFESEDEEDIDEIDVIREFFTDDNLTLADMLNNQWKNIKLIFKKTLLKDIDHNDSEILYLENIGNVFKNNIQELLTEEALLEGEQTSFFDEVYSVILDDTQESKQFEYILLLSKILKRHLHQIILNEYRMIIDRSCNLLSESFADLIMLYITKDPKTYLKNIFEAERNKAIKYNSQNVYPWNEASISEMHLERIISVLTSLGYIIDEIDSVETDDKDFLGFLKSIKEYADRDNYDIRAIPYEVIDITTSYLKVCLDKIKTKEGGIEDLRKLYLAATMPNSVANCIKQYRESSFAFRNKIVKENRLDLM